MASTQTKLSNTQVVEALKILGEWFPEEAENLKKHHDDIVHHIVEGTEPNEGAPLLCLQYQNYEIAMAAVEEAEVSLSLTPCVEAIGVVLVDAFLFVLGLVGLHSSNQQRITRALLRELGEDTLNGFHRAIQELDDAEGATKKALALFNLLSQVYNVGGFRIVLRELFDEMSWWEWVKTSVIAVAQIVAWFATDGAAFVAEVALNIMNATQLIEDTAKAVKACSSS